MFARDVAGTVPVWFAGFKTGRTRVGFDERALYSLLTYGILRYRK